MISLKTFLNWWNGFFFGDTRANTLCVFRICIGFFLFLNGVTLIPDMHEWYHPFDGIITQATSLQLYSNARLNLFSLLAPSVTVSYGILFLYVVSSFTFMIGYKTRLSAIVTFILLVSLQNRFFAILNSGDTVVRCMLFPMIFAPAHVMYSVDAWLAKKKGEAYSQTIKLTTVRMLQIQFSIIYLATTLFKLKGTDWPDGTAVYFSSRLVGFQRIVIPFIFDHMIFIKFFTWTALIIEGAMGSLVWIKELRLWVLLSGILLHMGIELTMSIGFFEWLMMAAYILYLEPQELDRFFEYVSRKVRNLSAQKS